MGAAFALALAVFLVGVEVVLLGVSYFCFRLAASERGIARLAFAGYGMVALGFAGVLAAAALGGAA